MSAELRINGQTVTLAEAAGWAALARGPDLRAFAVMQVAVSQAAEALGLVATDAEINAVFRAFRREHRLESSADLRVWMAERGLDASTATEACRHVVLHRKFAETITPDDIAERYHETGPAQERVEVYRIVVGSEDRAAEIRALVEERSESFCLLAMEWSEDAATARAGGYAGVLSRSDVSREIEAAIFGALPGDLVGPIRTDAGWEVLLVHACWTVPLDEAAPGIHAQLLDARIARILARAEVDPS